VLELSLRLQEKRNGDLVGLILDLVLMIDTPPFNNSINKVV